MMIFLERKKFMIEKSFLRWWLNVMMIFLERKKKIHYRRFWFSSFPPILNEEHACWLLIRIWFFYPLFFEQTRNRLWISDWLFVHADARCTRRWLRRWPLPRLSSWVLHLPRVMPRGWRPAPPPEQEQRTGASAATTAPATPATAASEASNLLTKPRRWKGLVLLS